MELEPAIHRGKFDPTFSYGTGLFFNHQLQRPFGISIGIYALDLRRSKNLKCDDCIINELSSQHIINLNLMLELYLYRAKNMQSFRSLKLSSGISFMKQYAYYKTININQLGIRETLVDNHNFLEGQHMWFAEGGITATVKIKKNFYQFGVMNRFQTGTRGGYYSFSTLHSFQIGRVFRLY
ncbi:hypothetical protein GYB22_09140 [bacterium]|nr:hypothetical protein [bacterium]